MTSILFKLLFTFSKIGLFTFGGGYAMIPLMEKEIIQANKWLSMKEFVDIIAIAEVTPGPIAVNSATYVGYKMAGVWGAAFATVGVGLTVICNSHLLGLPIPKIQGCSRCEGYLKRAQSCSHGNDSQRSLFNGESIHY